MLSILIVDDSRTARMFIKRCLEIVGYTDAEFIEAGDGKEALSLLHQKPADLVVSDLNMPLMDGETLLKWIRNTPTLKKIPVIFITSANNLQRQNQLLALGAQAVLGKPLVPAMLAQAVSQLPALAITPQ